MSQSQKLIDDLWKNYVKDMPFYPHLFPKKPILDHFAIIDLPHKNSGIEFLQKIFESLGFVKRGSGYIAEKINDFIWLGEEEIEEKSVQTALPQVVLADFRLEKLSSKNKNIVDSYLNKAVSSDNIIQLLTSRSWPLPTVADYTSVKEENPLLAWVLYNGRCVNHFGISIYLDDRFNSLADFNSILKSVTDINTVEGEIKGDRACGIEQSSSIGLLRSVKFQDGELLINSPFMEFVWRHKKIDNDSNNWNCYFNDFIASNATDVIESVLEISN